MRTAALLAMMTALAMPATVHAFCGFYVAGADDTLVNEATMVVMMREGRRTVLSMQNHYEGPPENFAMVIPVPEVLQEENVKVLPDAVFDRVDKLAAPRLVEYWEQDPCEVIPEPESVLRMYGPDVHRKGSYAYNCLMARRLAERGVRFIQLYNRGWDQHGNLPRDLSLQAQASDQPQAALVKDLKRRGLLDETLVIWGGEFGRTVYCQGGLSQTNYGRDHHPRCFTIWLAGGGIKPMRVR